MKEIKRIVHFIPGFDHGGIESRLLDWVSLLDLDEYQIDIIVCTNVQNNTIASKLKDKGCKFIEIPNMTPKNFLRFYKALKRCFKTVYDVAHCHNPVYGYFFLKLAENNKIPIRIMHSRTNQLDQNSSLKIVRNILKNNVYKYANRNLACSKSAGEWVFNNQSFIVLKNGINTEDFLFDMKKRKLIRNRLNINDDVIVLGTVGRLTPVKNQEFLLELIDYINKHVEHKEIKLIVIGEGPERENLEQKIKEKSLQNQVLLLGKLDNVNDYYNVMDIFLFPSIYEGFGTVAIESQTNGLPTLISSGIPDDVMVCNNIRKIDEFNMSLWYSNIMELVSFGRNNENYKNIILSCYDNKDTVRILEKIYNNIEEENRYE